MFGPFTLLDWSIVVYYFFTVLILAGVQLWRESDRTDYFTARCSWGWLNLGASLFSTSFLLEILLIFWIALGLNGRHAGFLAWSIIALFFLSTWYLWPAGQRALGSGPRAGYLAVLPRWIRLYSAGLFIFAFAVIKIYIILLVSDLIFGTGMHTFSLLLLFLSGLLVVMGGYRTILRLQLVQNWVILMGMAGFILWIWSSASGLEHVSNLIRQQAGSRANWLSEGGALSWSGLVGLPVLALWLVGGEHLTGQRFVIDSEPGQLRSGVLFSIGLRVALAALVLFPLLANLGVSRMPGLTWPAGAISFSFRSGMQGLFFAATFAALLTALTHSLHSGSYLITRELYQQLQPEADERELTLVGRLSTTALVLVGMSLVPFLKFHVLPLQLFLKVIPAFLSPPFLALFLVLRVQPGAAGKGVTAGIVAGIALGVLKTILEFAPAALIADWPFLSALKEAHFLHFAAFLFAVTFLICYLSAIFSSYYHKDGSDRKSTEQGRLKPAAGAGTKLVQWHAGVALFLFAFITGLWIIYFYPQ